MRYVALAAALFAVVTGSDARANSITIDFDFSGSSVSALGLINIPPNGSILAASASLTIPGAGVVTPSAGAASFSNLFLQATIDANIFGAQVDGFVTASQIGAAAASLLPGLASVVVMPPAVLSVSASVDCAGLLCGLVPITFPLTVMGPQTLAAGFTLMATNLSVSGLAALTGMFALTFDGNEVTVNLVGTEVGRSFMAMPEPSTALLAGAGLAALAAGRRLRRARQPS